MAGPSGHGPIHLTFQGQNSPLKIDLANFEGWFVLLMHLKLLIMHVDNFRQYLLITIKSGHCKC